MPKQPIEEKESSVFDFLRLGESYTSLILGIVVVIVSTVLLLSFVHNKNKTATPDQKTQIAQITPTPTTSNVAKAPSKESSVTIMHSPTVKPTAVVKKVTPTPTVVKVAKVNPTKYVAKAVTPTPLRQGSAGQAPKAKKPTSVPTKVKKPDAKVESKGTYKVAKGDNLWSIAEKNYKSGYNWVDIARVNNLNNPNNIHEGDTLVLPKVQSKVATVVQPTKPVVQPTKVVVKATPTPVKQIAKVTPTPTVAVANKITGKTYKIVQGDTLWDIAVRAYADGFQWVKIASSNKLLNPDIIHPGNTLTLPRDK